MATTMQSYIRHGIEQYVNALNPDPDDLNSTSSIPLFIAQPTVYNPKKHTPFVSIFPNKSNIITSGFYKDLNKDKSVQKTLTKYYFYKIVDKWIYNELLPLLAFIDTSSSKPQLIKSLEYYDVEKLANNTSEEIEKKKKYMEEILLTKDMVLHVLKKICKENNLNWYDLNKHEKKIKKVFYNYLLDKLKDSIDKYGNKNK